MILKHCSEQNPASMLAKTTASASAMFLNTVGRLCVPRNGVVTSSLLTTHGLRHGMSPHDGMVWGQVVLELRMGVRSFTPSCTAVDCIVTSALPQSGSH